MFERAGQVNARFAGGSRRQAEIIAALRHPGLAEDEINVIDRVEPGHWEQPVVPPGIVARLRARLGGTPAAEVTPPPSDLLILVHLQRSEALAEPVQEVFRRFQATRVNYYPPSRVPTRVFGADGAPPPPTRSEDRARG